MPVHSIILVQISLARTGTAKSFLVHPAAGGSASPVTIDDANGDILFPAQFGGTEVGNCTGIPAIAGGDGHPAAVFFSSTGCSVPHGLFWHIEKAEVRIIMLRNQFQAFIRILQFKLHITLASGKKDIANGHIGHFIFAVFSRNAKGAFRHYRHGRNAEKEAAVPGDGASFPDAFSPAVFHPG